MSETAPFDSSRRETLRGALYALPAWLAWPLAAAEVRPRLLQGPMLGDTGADYFTVWGRFSERVPIAIEYAENPQMNGARRSPSVLPEATNDYVAVVRVTGLIPATVYWYRVLVGGKPDPYRSASFPLRTAPASAAPVRIAFGSCARFARDAEQPIFRAISASRPDLFLWLGDHVYVDSESPHAFTDEYNQQRSVPSLQPLLRSVPQLATWDDHDYGANNSDRLWSGKETAFKAFRRYWANPAFGLPQAPGTFFRKHWAGIDLFFLDGRSWRDPPEATDSPAKTQLGAVQKAWLKTELLASKAIFKVLVSGGGWSTLDGAKRDESWGAYAHERAELLDFIRDNRIDGVFGISGDTHIGELNRIPRTALGSYDFYDLVASPLAQPTRDNLDEMIVAERVRPPYTRSTNFGVLEFETHPEPSVTLSLRDTFGEPVWTPLVLRARDLVVPRRR